MKEFLQESKNAKGAGQDDTFKACGFKEFLISNFQ